MGDKGVFGKLFKKRHSSEKSTGAGGYPLPPQWTQQATAEGKPFYANSVQRTTQWVHPISEPLPSGWQIRFDEALQPYYVEVATARAQWNHPSLEPGAHPTTAESKATATDAAARIAKYLNQPRPPLAATDGEWTPPGPGGDTPGPYAQWEVKLNSGRWMAFPLAANQAVAKAIAAAGGVRPAAPFPIDHCRRVDLCTWTQSRMDTGMVRPIRPLRADTAVAAVPPPPTAAAAAAAAVPGAVVATTGLQWEVRTDSGWRAYRPEHSTTISDGVRRGAPRVKLNIETGTGFTDYFITLQAPRFEQVRADGSGWPREVRSVSTGGNAWEIKTDEGWRPYSPEHSAEISAAVALGKASLTLVIITGTGPTPYVIDLASQPYRQVRSDGTGAPRELRRRQIAYTGGAAPPPSTPTIGAAADIPPPYVGQPPQADPAPTPAAAVAAAAADAGAGQDKPQPKDPRPSAPPVSPPPIPNDLLCPISMELLDDPVVAADGYTYEREVIEEWLKKNDTSPMTNVKLDHKMLVPNKTIKALIASAGYAD